MDEKSRKIEGGLAGAVIGDAMGTATETLTRRQVVDTYGRLEGIVAADHSPYSHGRPAGHVSDDSSQMLLICAKYVQNGRIAAGDIVDLLLKWSEDEDLFSRNAGPTTRAAILRLRAGEDPAIVGRGDVFSGTGLSNGAAMKAAPAGWFNPGDISSAVRDAAEIAMPTHATQIAIAGAAAVSSAIAIAMTEDATVDAIVEAALRGAREGEVLGLKLGREAAGATVFRRMTEAVRIGVTAGDVWEAMDEISNLVGCGLPANEAVPAALGLFAAAKGDIRDTIVGTVNMGNDADTVSTIAGAIVGTFNGIEAIPADWYETVIAVNDLDLHSVALSLSSAIARRYRRPVRSDG
jgi:ADP-ribosylglycohydrolase